MTAKNCLCRSVQLIALLGLMTVTFTVAQSDDHQPKHPRVHATSVTTTPIPSTLFDMTTHSDVLFGTPWPTPPIFGLRLWDTGTGWGQINTAKGIYDWTTLDNWIAAAGTHTDQLIYVFGMTPTWASSKPTDATCDYGAGFCDAPADLKTDGTGTDQHFIDFVTAVAKHAPNITYWELWNTPHDKLQWTGTNAQLVRMAKDANTYIKKYIAGAKIISPANGQLNYPYPSSNCTMPDKMGGYLSAGLGKYIDIMGIHTYYTVVPENIIPVIQCYQTTMATYKVTTLPIWSTEGAWGANINLPNQSDQAAFVARLYLLLWSNGVVRHYWYAWDDDNTGTLSDNGVINSVGTAFQQIEGWMVGRTMSTLCSESTSGIWTCGLTGASGYAAQAVWYPGGSASYTAPSQYINYLDLGGTLHEISSGATVTVGAEPILLQNQDLKIQNPNFVFSESTPFPEVTVGTTGTTGAITVASQDGFAATVTLNCPTTYGSGSCNFSPATVNTFPAAANLVINGSSFTPGAYQLVVQGTSGAITNSFTVPFNVGDFSITGPAAITSSPGQAIANLSLNSLFTYSGQVNGTCDASALSGATCTLSPSGTVSIASGTTVPLAATITIPTDAAAGSYNITVTAQDASGGPSHSFTIPLTVGTGPQDFGFGAFTPTTQTISSGQSASYSFTLLPVNGSFPNAVNLTCSGGPSISQCSFSPDPATPGANLASVMMTVTTTSASARHHQGAIAVFYAPWLVLPAIILIASRARKTKRGRYLPISLVSLFLLALLLTSCGGTGTSASNSQSQPPQKQGTPAGTYNITVTGTSGSLTHQATAVTLVVN